MEPQVNCDLIGGRDTVVVTVAVGGRRVQAEMSRSEWVWRAVRPGVASLSAFTGDWQATWRWRRERAEWARCRRCDVFLISMLFLCVVFQFGLAEDMVETSGDSDEEDENDSSEEETPLRMKVDSTSKASVPDKKAKVITPAGIVRTGGDRKKAVHTATPHPTKQVGKQRQTDAKIWRISYLQILQQVCFLAVLIVFSTRYSSR
ncbi:hypothetical protein AXF42_Ash002654 [Apostasia shenzhenica]|uniref:Transmembrane protein n=1 Tax=Apostasia shenzhenica TaxID=1088818 RepID=A0A2I0A6X1_9ASPA|nr:hypothetical protein AXF42_Ash002654 [Apostasia shenzhenica]